MRKDRRIFRLQLQIEHIYYYIVFQSYTYFSANADRVAVPLSGPGGKIAVLELKITGRIPDGVMAALVHGAAVMDFQWDPFNSQRLAVGKVFSSN